jgi:hypothetical protein
MAYADREWKPSRQPTTRCVAASATHNEAKAIFSCVAQGNENRSRAADIDPNVRANS